MAFLWRRHDDNDDWEAIELGQSVVLDNGDVSIADTRDRKDSHPRRVVHLIRCSGNNETWILLASPALQVTVNGLPAACGILRLADRDAVRAGSGRPVYFTTESIARAEPYPASEAVFCPRCKREIGRGDSAVRCPRCRVWHHHGGEAGSCWQYSATCALCDQPSDLDAAAFAWTPGDL